MSPARANLYKVILAIIIVAICFVFIAPVLGSFVPSDFHFSPRFLGSAILGIYFCVTIPIYEFVIAFRNFLRVRKEGK